MFGAKLQLSRIGFKLNQSDSIVLLLFVIATLGFALVAYKQYAQGQLISRMAAQGKYNALPTEVIGRHPHFRGAASCPFTLVEFGDYQCGPCRAENLRVIKLFSRNQSDLRFVFRNMPLTSIHPLAMQAAAVAEEATSLSSFWQIHDFFYSGGPLDRNKIMRADSILSDNSIRPLAEKLAYSRVDADMAEATNLGVEGTPTFVLCCPDGDVRRIRSLDQVEDIIRSVSRKAH